MRTVIKRISLVEPKPAGHHFFDYVKLPRLGLPLMGAILKRKGYDVHIYCEDIAPVDHDDLHASDLVGISITTSTAPAGYQLADSLRESGIPVVIGGPHATFMPEEALQHAPYCIRREGEDALPELIDHISQGSEPTDVLGLSYNMKGEMKHNPDRAFIEDLDSLPFPDLDLIEGSRRITVKPVQTSRGCPFDCVFCSVTSMCGQKHRFRSKESVIEELKSHNGRNVIFYDDNFATNRTRAKQLCEEMIKETPSLRWSAQVRADVYEDEELLKLLHRSGCAMLYIGLESINPATLEAFNKRQKVEEIEECIRKLHEYKIMMHGMFIFGADEDPPQIIRDTAVFALRNGVDTVQFATLTPLPGSRLFENMDSDGRILTRDWSLYDGMHVVFAPDKMSPLTLHNETIKAWKVFYTLSQCAKLLFRFQFTRASLRYYGHRQIKRFEATNRDFVKWVHSIGDRAREISRTKQPASGETT